MAPKGVPKNRAFPVGFGRLRCQHAVVAVPHSRYLRNAFSTHRRRGVVVALAVAGRRWPTLGNAGQWQPGLKVLGKRGVQQGAFGVAGVVGFGGFSGFSGWRLALP